MEPEEAPHHHHGGIYNYFQGATIHNMVINGNMTKNGTESYSNSSSEVRTKVTDEQIAHALIAINGKKQVLNNYQLWLGACCLLMGKYGFPRNLEQCCERINGLPYHGETLALECKYESVRKFSYLKFVKEDVDNWDSYQPQEDEKKLFYGCLQVKRELDKKLQEGSLTD